MLRQSLDADSVYADIALHASGLTSLQYRDAKGAITQEQKAALTAHKAAMLAMLSAASTGEDPYGLAGRLAAIRARMPALELAGSANVEGATTPTTTASTVAARRSR